MEILGLLTIALVAGTLARTLYREAVPNDVVPSLLLGAVGVALAYGVATVTGATQLATTGDVAMWVASLTGACIAIAVAEALRGLVQPLRSLDRAS